MNRRVALEGSRWQVAGRLVAGQQGSRAAGGRAAGRQVAERQVRPFDSLRRSYIWSARLTHSILEKYYPLWEVEFSDCVTVARVLLRNLKKPPLLYSMMASFV